MPLTALSGSCSRTRTMSRYSLQRSGGEHKSTRDGRGSTPTVHACIMCICTYVCTYNIHADLLLSVCQCTLGMTCVCSVTALAHNTVLPFREEALPVFSCCLSHVTTSTPHTLLHWSVVIYCIVGKFCDRKFYNIIQN